MNATHPRQQIRLYMLALIILVVGLGSSVAIYLNAAEPADNSLVYDYEHSKKFRHEMEAAGGKLIMLLSETARDIEALFQGKNLAYTIGAMTIVISSGLFYVARQIRKRTP